MRISLGMLLLGIYLLAVGVFPLVGVAGIAPWGFFVHLLAIAAGVAILLHR